MTTTHQDSKAPEQIEAEIDATRDRMDRTLDSIQRKVSPGELVDQGLRYFGDNAGEFSDNLIRAIKRNPVPVTLAGASLAWLAISSAMPTRAGDERERGWYPGSDSDYRDASAGWAEARSSGGYAPRSSVAGDARPSAHEPSASDSDGEVQDTFETLKKGAKSASDAMRSHAESVAEAAKQGYNAAVADTMSSMHSHGAELSQRTLEAGATAQHQIRQARQGVANLLDEQPLILGGLALAVGAAIGAAVPATQREDELLGESSDRLKEEIGAQSRRGVSAARDVVDSAVDAGATEASRQGLAGDRARVEIERTSDKAKNVARTARDAAKDEAKTKSKSPSS